MRLTDSPLDDYQRLCFSQSMDLKDRVRHQTYKSNLAPTMHSLVSHLKPQLNHSSMTAADSKSDKGLMCFEYQFPDLVAQSQETADSNTHIQYESGNRPYGLNAETDTPTAHRMSTEPSDGALDATLLLPELQQTTSPRLTGHKRGYSSPSGPNGTTISKNQQFRISNQSNTHKFINTNNCILWTNFDKNEPASEENFVFLTGIWRLYQDVMKGLIQIPRKGKTSKERQDFCRQEFDFIMSNCFCDDQLKTAKDQSDPVDYSRKFHRRRSTGSISFTQKTKSNNSVTSENSGNTHSTSNSSVNYLDFHWFDISEKVRSQIFEQFKQHLEKDRNVDCSTIPKAEEYIQRIRGGYIKIQGTWVPWYIAKLICIRFCFPIRYLLVPIFGEQFPVECENYFFNVHMTNLKEFLENEHLINTVRRRQKSTGLATPPFLTSSTFGNGSIDSPFSDEREEMEISPFHKYSNNLSPNYSPRMRKRRRSDNNLSPMSPSTKLAFRKTPPIREEPEPYEHYTSGFSTIDNKLSTNNTVKEEIHPYRKRALSWSYTQNTSQRTKLPPISSLIESINWKTNSDHVNVSEPTPTVQTLSKLASFYTTRGHKYSYPSNICTVSSNEHNKLASPVKNSNMETFLTARENQTGSHHYNHITEPHMKHNYTRHRDMVPRVISDSLYPDLGYKENKVDFICLRNQTHLQENV
ncbi:Transcriptional repressor XBP1 [Nakaseomyces glabratus]|nr:APSES-type HTH DNA-binding domain profile [Nakaseomyces glabratus]KTB19586.1 Transcriptional repressor XBP1 [Nakaseomyces glabratus]KTB25244.1 Transcriptional repressor XBP1 [Nakaseomyces glabratus]QNG13820.1 uncharacterized protein GWK60_G02607 [Nakaseomyces glabratus]SCV13121.1 uncharacterized protein CGFF_00678 [Nakaseomyces glabratus]